MEQISLVAFCLLLLVSPVLADNLNTDLKRLFPDRVGTYILVKRPAPADALAREGVVNPSEKSDVIAGQAEYAGRSNQRFLVEVVRFHQDSEAYSLLSIVAALAREKKANVELGSDYGTSSFELDQQLAFFKGQTFARITSLLKTSANEKGAFARALAETIDKGEGGIPPLVKHLPEAPESQKKAIFLDRFTSLQALLPNQPILNSIETERDADAAFVKLGAGNVLLVEYHTPQLAKENDDRLVAKINELWKLGQSAPTAYRRVGNYSVFVFDGSDLGSAKQLIEQVKYEQVVQWLGDNPNILKEAERRYVETTLGVFIAVLKASGFALIGCLGLGGLCGALLFSRRRAQQRTQEAFSDAGGMLRLNIDELTPQTDPGRLLGPGQ